MNPIVFTTQGRATFSEVDPFGHVNTQHYLAYYLNHRFTGLREEIGLDLKTLAELPVAFFTSKVEIDFIKPLFGDDEYNITSQFDEFGVSNCLVSMTMKSAKRDTVISKCRLTMVCVDPRLGKPVSWPSDLVQKFFREPSA